MSEPSRVQKIGSLPPTLQGIALDLNVDEAIAITTEEHSSEAHGEHFDIYLMRRLSESEVIMWKWHSTDIDRMSDSQKRLVDNLVNRSLTEEDEKNFRDNPIGGC